MTGFPPEVFFKTPEKIGQIVLPENRRIVDRHLTGSRSDNGPERHGRNAVPCGTAEGM